jgi:hypothetical protein
MVVAHMRSAVGPLEVCGSAVLSFAVKLWCEVMQCAVVWGVEGILYMMVRPVVGLTTHLSAAVLVFVRTLGCCGVGVMPGCCVLSLCARRQRSMVL